MSGFYLEFQWDKKTTAMLEAFQHSQPYWKEFMDNLSHSLGEKSVEFIKPFTTAKVGYHGYVVPTNRLHDSLNFEVNNVGDGFEVTFSGAFYGNYIDEGNGTEQIYPHGSYLAIYGRVGDIVDYRRSVKPMGQGGTGWKPTHFSNKTAKEMSLVRSMQDYANVYLRDLMRKLVRG